MLYTKLEEERREKKEQAEKITKLESELKSNKEYCVGVFSQLDKCNEFLKTVLRSKGEKSENPLNLPGSVGEWLGALKGQYSSDMTDTTKFSELISGISDLLMASASEEKLQEGQRLAEQEIVSLKSSSSAMEETKKGLEVELHTSQEENKELKKKVETLQEQVVSLQSIANRNLPYIIFENKEFNSSGVESHKHICGTCAIEFDDVQKQVPMVDVEEKKEDETQDAGDASSLQKINEALIKEVCLLRTEVEVSQTSIQKSQAFKTLVDQSRDLLTSYNELQEVNLALNAEVASLKS